MRITKVTIPKDDIQNGLEAVNMDRLGQIVLLAGKNGSGKTRLLNLIQEKISSKPTKSIIHNSETNLSQYTERVSNAQRQLEQPFSQQQIEAIKENIERYQQN